MKTSMHIYRTLLGSLGIGGVSDKSFRENRNTCLRLKCFLRLYCRSLNNVQKNCTDGEEPDDNMAHAHCML